MAFAARGVESEGDNMGNRAHIILKRGDDIGPAIYLHWNGGPESVYPFLDELRRRGVRSQPDYATARLCQIIGDFFDGEREEGSGTAAFRDQLSLGVLNGPDRITPSNLKPYDHGDNGVFVIELGETFTVRRFTNSEEWTAEQVASEERIARKAKDYHDEIPALFARLRQQPKETANVS